MEEALRATLLATAAVATRVGRRIDWGVRASADLPAVRLFEISGLPQMNWPGRPAGRGRASVSRRGAAPTRTPGISPTSSAVATAC